jgi:hypothetical protein
VKTNSNIALVPISFKVPRNNLSLNRPRIVTPLRFLYFHSFILSIADEGSKWMSTVTSQRLLALAQSGQWPYWH